MYKADVLSHWGDNGAAVARAIGITKSAVSQWGDVIPEAMAYRVQEASGGVLKVDPKIYRTDLAESA
jgi:transcriptional repressor of cell division inhibition gene dicB